MAHGCNARSTSRGMPGGTIESCAVGGSLTSTACRADDPHMGTDRPDGAHHTSAASCRCAGARWQQGDNANADSRGTALSSRLDRNLVVARHRRGHGRNRGLAARVGRGALGARGNRRHGAEARGARPGRAARDHGVRRRGAVAHRIHEPVRPDGKCAVARDRSLPELELVAGRVHARCRADRRRADRAGSGRRHLRRRRLSRSRHRVDC